MATRRSAACSSAIALSSWRASVFAIVVAISSVNAASRCSVPDGRAFSRTDVAIMTPQSLPSTLIGAPAEERIPISRADAVTASSLPAAR